MSPEATLVSGLYRGILMTGDACFVYVPQPVSGTGSEWGEHCG
jgi:hypothetical protein